MIMCNKCKILLFNKDIVRKKFKILLGFSKSSDLEFAIFRCPKCFNTIKITDEKELRSIDLQGRGL